jgi:hypothetical protein
MKREEIKASEIAADYSNIFQLNFNESLSGLLRQSIISQFIFLFEAIQQISIGIIFKLKWFYYA